VKILIISSPRAGSTVLTEVLGKIFNLKKYHEPFNKHWGSHYKKNYEFSKNCIVKVMAYEKEIDTNKTSVEFLSEFSKQFDTVILLDRLDYKKQLESYTFMRQIRYDGDWQSSYVFDDKVDLLREDYYLTLQKENIELISKKIKSEILFYENIYSNNREKIFKEFKKVNISLPENILDTLLNTKYKLRKESIDESLI
jgi:hypothetical protein